MQQVDIIGTEYSYRIPALLSRKQSGYVHSVFSHGFNIIMGDSLVFIGNKKNGLLPFGIHPQEDITSIIPLVHQQEEVCWNEDQLMLELSKVRISLINGRSFFNGVSPLQSNEDIRLGFERLYSFLLSTGKQNGFDIDIAAFVEKLHTGHLNKEPESEKYLFKLLNVAVSYDQFIIEETLHYFLGKGKGLPSPGTDLLVGFFAFDSIVPFISPHFNQLLSQLLANESINTDLSKEHLRYALKHEFSSTVTDVLNHLGRGSEDDFRQVFEMMAAVGHHSGVDTLFGILMGMLAFNNPLEQ